MAGVFKELGYKPHPGQRRIHKAKAKHRFRVVCAGRRTGKSFSGGHELAAHAVEAYLCQDLLDPHGRRMEYWIVGPEYSDAEKEFRVLWKDLKDLGLDEYLDHPGSYNDPIGGNMHVSLYGGRFQVHAKSAKYPDSLVGEGLDGVILAEAAKLKNSIWPKFIRPMLVDKRGWALMTSTPEGKNWFYEAFMNPRKGYTEWWSVRMPSWINNILFPLGKLDPEVASLGEGLTAEAFNQEIGAEFSEFVGRVFKEFDEDIHCRPLHFNPEWRTFAAVDYGWTNPFVWLLIQVDHWNNVYVIGEYYKSHMRIDEIPAELLEQGLCPPQLKVFYPDPAAPGDTAVLEEMLKIRSGGNTGGELKERLRLIRKWLDIDPKVKHLPINYPERLPRLFVDPLKCPNFVREFNDYRYPENKSDADKNDAELPKKVDDHTPEAVGRFFAGFFGHKVEGNRARVSKSTLSGGNKRRRTSAGR